MLKCIKTVINIKDILYQAKPLNLTESLIEKFNDHRQKIDQILDEVKKVKDPKTRIYRSDMENTILPDRNNKRKGKVVVKEDDKTHICHVIKTKSNFIMIYLKGKLINFRKFYAKFNGNGLIKGKQNIINELRVFNKKKKQNMEEYRKRNGIPSNNFSKN